MLLIMRGTGKTERSAFIAWNALRIVQKAHFDTSQSIDKAYSIPLAYVFQNDNVKVVGKVAYLPIYMLMFLGKEAQVNPQSYKPNLEGLR